MNRTELARRAKAVPYGRIAHKTVIYIVCAFLCLMSVLPFLVMFVNATRTSAAIQQGVSLIPGDQLLTNMDTLYHRQNFDVLAGMRNSLIISAMTTLLALYFSNLTAFGSLSRMT